MRTILLLPFVLLAAAAAVPAQAPDRTARLRPAEGAIALDQTFALFFPEAMVDPDQIGRDGAPTPLIFEPALELECVWRTQTEAAITVKSQPVPGRSYNAGLAPGLKKADGSALEDGLFAAASYEAPPLLATKNRNRRSYLPLAAEPSVALRFNYPVRYADAVGCVAFVDRDTRERLPAQLLLPAATGGDDGAAAPESGGYFTASPRAPLPPDRDFDLVIDGLKDAATGTPMPYPQALALGTTRALRIESAGARHEALGEPGIVLRFNQALDIDSVSEGSVTVEPPVAGLKTFPYGWEVRLEGEFDPAGSYTVRVAPGLRAASGYTLDEGVAKTARFDAILPSIYFPETRYFTRADLGVKLKMLHANTGPLRWKLAPLPNHKITAAEQMLGQTAELGIDLLGLSASAEGAFPGALGTEASYRDIEVAGPIASGAYLLEVSTKTPNGNLAANRALIYANSVFVTQKETHDEIWLRVATMAEAAPVAGARVRLVSGDSNLLETGETGEDGVARFPRSVHAPPHPAVRVLVDAPGGGTAVVPLSRKRFVRTGYPSERGRTRKTGVVFADSSLYRPGTEMKFKGIARRLRPDKTPAPLDKTDVRWSIYEGWRGKVVAQGTATADEFGGWEGGWEIPADLKLGSYRVVGWIGESEVGYASFRVEEFRVPLFEVELTGEVEPGKTAPGDTARVKVASRYFHGGPNAGALARWTLRWREHWAPVEGCVTEPAPLPEGEHLPRLPEVEGEVRLGADGTAWIEVPLPEGAAAVWSRFRFDLEVDVLSPEGQTITDGFRGKLQPRPLAYGVRLNPAYGDGLPPALDVRVGSVDAADEAAHGAVVDLVLLRHETSTAREQVGADLYRYRNFTLELPVASFPATIPADGAPLRVEVDGKPGRYTVIARPRDGAPAVSHTVTLAAEAPARYPVWDDQSFDLEPDKPEYLPGEVAHLAPEAPFAGRAWVCVETDEVVEQFEVELAENAGRIDLPIKPHHYPDVYVTVYLVRPGGADALPAERFGRVRLNVDRPELTLEVTPTFHAEEVEPGAPVRGEVLVLAGGEPLAGADVTLVAVDEAVLRLGRWRLPGFIRSFYPIRNHGVRTSQALDGHRIAFEEDEMAEKGYLIGGGGEGGEDLEGQQAKRPRQNFLARAHWQTGLRTDADGRVRFDFEAPDNLTAFRLTAVATAKDHRFGDGRASFKVNKRLMLEPALPRFLRDGDEVVLRATARQSVADGATVAMRVEASEALELLAPAAGELGPLAADAPGIFTVRARVKRGFEEATVRFDAAITGGGEPVGDSVEVALPVHRAGVLQSIGLYGQLPAGPGEFALADAAPEFWPEAQGEFGLTVSRTPFLPKLAGLPQLLEYPHGCFEQRSSKLLVYTQLAAMLQYLPEHGGAGENYRERVEGGLRYFAKHQRPDGFLPYWSSSPKRNAYVTVQVAWLAAQARALGYTVPEPFGAKLAGAVDMVVAGRVPHRECSETTRAFALFVQAETPPPAGKAKPRPRLDVMGELYLQRDRLGDETRAFLAVAMHAAGAMPEERALLAREIDNAPPRGAFDPRDFHSPTRGQAVAYIAQSRIADPVWKRELEPEMRARLDTLLEDSRRLSTQESLWLLLALNTALEADGYKALPLAGSGADLASPNGFSIGWRQRALSAVADLKVKLDAEPAYYLVDAKVLRDDTNVAREDRGLKIERVVRNLTDPARTGAEAAPYRIGDELLVTYRVANDRRHYYLALVDELPAGLETVNFNLAQVAEFYAIPRDADANSLWLSHNELRDRSANLYFDEVRPGGGTYSVLARVTAGGQFTWPAPDLTPMYEPRWGALGGAAEVFAE